MKVGSDITHFSSLPDKIFYKLIKKKKSLRPLPISKQIYSTSNHTEYSKLKRKRVLLGDLYENSHLTGWMTENWPKLALGISGD